MTGSSVTPDLGGSRSVQPPPVWLLALITFSGTLAMHIFVPALPFLARDLGTNAGSAQLTISFYILGLGVGQLVIGPVSDRYGRRPVLLAGLVLYTVAGFAAAISPNIYDLVIARLFQAVGGCAGLVLGRAIARDGASVPEASRRLALMNLIAAVGPGVAPIFGAEITATVGWRAIFFVLCALGFANMVLTWRLLPETGVSVKALSFRKVAQGYRRLIGARTFLGYAIGGGCSTTALYAFIAAAPFIFINQLHRSSHEVGIYLGLVFLGVWLGSLVASHFANRSSVARLIIRGSCLSLFGAGILLVSAISGHLSVPLTIGSMMLFSFGAGIASPSALAEALSIDPLVVASASGLYGFTQMVIGAICTALTGIGSDPALAVATVLVAAGLIGQWAFWIAIRGSRSKLNSQIARTKP